MADMTETAARPTAEQPHDEHLWLEEITGEAPLQWVARQNARTLTALEGPQLRRLEADVLDVMDSTDRIPMVAKHGPHYYNFWRDAEHPRGVFRRTTWESWLGEDTEWEAGHIAGAQHIPLGQLPERYGEVPADEDVYVICRSGGRSLRATAYLQQYGFDPVNVLGGMGAWMDAGKPMVSETDETPTVR